jgi:hypothetical protein
MTRNGPRAVRSFEVCGFCFEAVSCGCHFRVLVRAEVLTPFDLNAGRSTSVLATEKHSVEPCADQVASCDS